MALSDERLREICKDQFSRPMLHAELVLARRVAAEARDEALEEAAKIAEQHGGLVVDTDPPVHPLARDIRALKSQGAP